MRKIELVALTLIVSITVLGGCNLTGAYLAAKVTNDITFGAALIRICSPIADLAAERQLNSDALVARELLCDSHAGR